MRMAASSLLAVEGITKQYAQFTLKDVSFHVAPGRIAGLIGKNGAGKSTTLKAILNMIHLDAGLVRMFGQPFLDAEEQCKQEIGVVFGGIDFYGYKRLVDITAVTKRFYKQWDQAVYAHYMQTFELAEEKQLRQLSNGMKVKYLLVLALSHHARLFILDEPTTGLDPVSREELLQIFQNLIHGSQRSILFSTHITSDLDKCADDITYLKNGRILASTNKAAFLRSFEHLKAPDEPPLTLEEIMVRTERKAYHDDAFTL